jgi:4-deoxy-L-threo-5-hexosulose-uronate ketol-isomerase
MGAQQTARIKGEESRMTNIAVRQAVSPTEAMGFDTASLRSNFLVEGLFAEGEMRMTYSHYDRTVVGGVLPVADAIPLVSSKPIGSERFLERREMGIFNIGGDGILEVDGQTFELGRDDCLYVPMGTDTVRFRSADAADPARYFFISVPAHHRHSTRRIIREEANRLDLGGQQEANRRILRQYIHPDICKSCQLVMGMTWIETGSVWNTMPCHTHDRRSEVYLYYDMEPDARIFHFMGEPTETRHIVIANEQAVISPGWSIHSGAGTGRYAFIWAMAGDNQDFGDMDMVAMETLR